MKRKGKCVGKKKFAYKSEAIQKAKNIYFNNGIELGIYECPTCLDFHLTSKYCNIKHRHTKWIKKQVRSQWLEFLRLERLHDKPPSANKVKKRKKKEYKQSIVPLSKQREIFKQLNENKQIQQETPNNLLRTLWRRIKRT